MSKRQNHLDFKGWFRAEDIGKNTFPTDRIIRTIGDCSEQKTHEPSIFPRQSRIRKGKA